MDDVTIAVPSLPAGYLTKLSQLHSIVTLAQQLSGDVQSCSSHKYIAHQRETTVDEEEDQVVHRGDTSI